MKSINRMIAVIKPKKPYVDWINSLPGMDESPVTLESAAVDVTCYLIPEFDSIEQGQGYILKNVKKILEVEFESWDQSGAYWPKKLDRRYFNDFFQVEVHSEVIDMVKGTIEEEY